MDNWSVDYFKKEASSIISGIYVAPNIGGTWNYAY